MRSDRIVERIKDRLPALVGVAAIAVISLHVVYRAAHKPFWFDEAVEVLESSSQPYSSILLDGPARQCSPAPLYYVFQKLVVARASISQSILTSYRAVSIASGVSTLVLLLIWFTRRLGPSWGVLSVMTLAFGPQFLRYAAENRPYMLWVFLFTAALILTSSLAYRQWDEIGRGIKTLLGLSIFGLALVSGGGMIQAVGFLAVLSIWPQSLDLRRWIKGPAFRFQLAAAGPAIAAGVYYAFRACTNYDGGEWDLLRTGDWRLIRYVIDVLWPTQLPGCGSRTDPCGVIGAGLNVAVIVAAVTPFALWKKRWQLPAARKFILSVALTALVQLACAVVIGVLVARAHYFFIPRIFIFLIVLRAALAVCGAHLLVTWLAEKLEGRYSFVRRGSIERLALIGIVLSLANSLYFAHRYSRQEASLAPGPTLTDATCPPVDDRSLALVDAKAPSEEYKLNFIVAFDRRLKACGWAPGSGPPLYVVPNYVDELTYDYEIIDGTSPQAPILGFFRTPLGGAR